MKLAMIFPGQGSQSVGMMRAYAGLPEIDKVLEEAKDALGEHLLRLLDQGPEDALKQTVNTQPAMVTAVGIQTLHKVNFQGNHNLLIVATSLALGLLPAFDPNFYSKFPKDFQVIFGSSIMARAIASICCSPPDSVPPACRRRWASTGKLW